jgi:hypothetical protein
MAAEGDLESFRTPGGHLRIVAASLGGLTKKGNGGYGETSVLHNKHEEVEHIRVEAQLLREKRELERLKAEQDREARAAKEANELERRRIELEQERVRVQNESVKLQQAQERAARRAEKALANFRSRWLEKGLAWCPSFLSSEERQHIANALRVEIESRQPYEEPIMGGVLQDVIMRNLNSTEKLFWLAENLHSRKTLT